MKNFLFNIDDVLLSLKEFLGFCVVPVDEIYTIIADTDHVVTSMTIEDMGTLVVEDTGQLILI